MAYKCEILADSISEQGHRLTTFKLTYPRIIHAEMLRHRMLSRNVASSRAIPFEKMVKDVEEDPFIPLVWQKSHKGMQGSEYWTDNDTVTVDEGDEYERYTKIYSATEHFITEWLEARDLAIAQSYELNRLGVTKQLCNRLLEPFVWTTELVSGTEWNGFFELRCPKYYAEGTNKHYKSWKDLVTDFPECENYSELDKLKVNESQAEIHIQKIAEMMWDEINSSKPKILQSGEWHVPYEDNLNDLSENLMWNKAINSTGFIIESPLVNAKLKIATARAARISFTTLGDNPKIDYEADIRLHDRLLESKHASPFEHCAKVMSDEEYQNFRKGYTTTSFRGETRGWCNNYRSFIQYRYLIENQ